MYDEAKGAAAGGEESLGTTFAEAAIELEGMEGKKDYDINISRKGVGIVCGSVSCILLVCLGLWLNSAATAASAIANGAAAEMKIHKIENLCDATMKLSAEVRIRNPSTWDFSMTASAFHVKDSAGVLVNQGALPHTTTNFPIHIFAHALFVEEQSLPQLDFRVGLTDDHFVVAGPAVGAGTGIKVITAYIKASSDAEN